MKLLSKGACIAALFFGLATPASAMPVAALPTVPTVPVASGPAAEVQQVHYHRRGYRVYRPHRPRYRQYRHVAPRAHHRYSSAHVQWCYGRYRSYRASDNTYQPYNGPRRQCRSPYR